MKTKIFAGAVLTDKSFIYELIEVPTDKNKPIITLIQATIPGAYIPLYSKKKVGEVVEYSFDFFKRSSIISYDKFLEYQTREKAAYAASKELAALLGITHQEVFVKLIREQKDGIQLRLTTKQVNQIIEALNT